MKNKILLVSSLAITLLSSCSSDNEISYITFKDYVDMETSAVANQKDIFVFTSTSCSHCQNIRSYLEEYKANVPEGVHVYELCVDISNGAFKDTTIGLFSKDPATDGLKQLDNRLTDYLNTTKTNIFFTKGIYKFSSAYSFVATPLIIWYDSGLEVKMINNVELMVEDDDGNITQDLFNAMMEYPETYPDWNTPFDLTSF